jgi:hypothetical protein
LVALLLAFRIELATALVFVNSGAPDVNRTDQIAGDRGL